MEMDYRLVENEGLFQEYLEMGEHQLHRYGLLSGGGGQRARHLLRRSEFQSRI